MRPRGENSAVMKRPLRRSGGMERRLDRPRARGAERRRGRLRGALPLVARRRLRLRRRAAARPLGGRGRDRARPSSAPTGALVVRPARGDDAGLAVRDRPQRRARRAPPAQAPGRADDRARPPTPAPADEDAEAAMRRAALREAMEQLSAARARAGRAEVLRRAHHRRDRERDLGRRASRGHACPPNDREAEEGLR